jgi:hypothetical protein
MKKTSYLFLLIILILWLVIYFKISILSKINYSFQNSKNIKEKVIRSDIKDIKLQKEIVLFIKNLKYREKINLNLWKDYFIINWNYCDINDSFFTFIENDLKKHNIVYKSKIDIENVKYIKIWKTINKNNLKYNICSFINSKKISDYIEIEIENQEYSEKEINEIKNYIKVGSYKIDKYYKTPIESVLNSQNLIDKISYELVYPGENISILETMLKDWWKWLLKSNVLKDWQIIKDIWWWSCLASTIIFRTLLDSWINIKSQKSHNIYYENIYWKDKIWLDSTIYEDENFFVDLIFENSYVNPIIFIPSYSDKSIKLDVYSKEKEYNTKLFENNIVDKDKISWKYEVYDKNNKLIIDKEINSKYDKIDSF